jgi:hypothetical protein
MSSNKIGYLVAVHDEMPRNEAVIYDLENACEERNTVR